MTNILLNYFLTNKKKTELESQGIVVPPDFMTNGLMYGMLAPNIPFLGYIITEKNAKELIAQKALLDEKGEVPVPVPVTESDNSPSLPPLVNITAVDQNGNKLNRANFASLPAKLDSKAVDDLIGLFKDKVFDTAITDENGNTNLFYPEKRGITIISHYKEKLSKLYFAAGKVPSTLEYKIEVLPEATEEVCVDKTQNVTKSRNTK
nr:hypothetical protein [uncultured Psychroserpens sp.]